MRGKAPSPPSLFHLVSLGFAFQERIFPLDYSRGHKGSKNRKGKKKTKQKMERQKPLDQEQIMKPQDIDRSQGAGGLVFQAPEQPLTRPSDDDFPSEWSQWCRAMRTPYDEEKEGLELMKKITKLEEDMKDTKYDPLADEQQQQNPQPPKTRRRELPVPKSYASIASVAAYATSLPFTVPMTSAAISPPVSSAISPQATQLPTQLSTTASAAAAATAAGLSRDISKSHAYVWLVMRGDRFVPGALISAWSVKKSGSTKDLVCMITEDVSETARLQLATVFTRVIIVPYIQTECLPMNKKFILLGLSNLSRNGIVLLW